MWIESPANPTLRLVDIPRIVHLAESHPSKPIVLVDNTFHSRFYSSARELKRLDVILRSSLYAHFSESLTGLATIWAYDETDRFRRESEDRVNIENRFACAPTGYNARG